MRRLSVGRCLVWGLLLLALGALGREAYQVFLGSNFHTVVAGRVYRSAQLSPQELADRIEAEGIRTVVNLRGSADPLLWFLDEARVTHRLQVCQEDICFSAGHLPSVWEMQRLVEVLDRTDYPVLLHCRRGADRTGMTAAVVVLLQEGGSLRQARAQLGVRYGHVALGRPASLDTFLDLYAAWLAQHGQEHRPARFRSWLRNDYCPENCRCVISNVRLPTPIRRGEPFLVCAHFRNTSLRTWHLRAGRTAGVHGIYTLWDPSGNLFRSGRAGLFDTEVAPNAGVDLAFALPALPAPGAYHLQLDLVDEQQCSFYQAGSEPWEQTLQVP